MRINAEKTLEPFVVEIDNKSGVVTLVDPSDKIRYTSNKSINDYFIYRYISAREVFDPNNYDYYYNTVVKLLSADNVYFQFRRTLRKDSPDSPFKIYQNMVRGDLKVKSIQYFKSNSVQVRFTVEMYATNGSVTKRDRIAIIDFKYTDNALNQQQRYINPLGFLVTAYKVDDEYLS